MAVTESTHYVLILEVQKVTKITKTQATGSRWDEEKVTGEDRTVTEVARIVIKDKGLPELKDRGTQHLALVEDEI